MKAAVLTAFSKPLVVCDVPEPVMGDDGALVRVEANGICRSDWHAWKGHWPTAFKLPHVLGHEITGTVEAVGAAVRGFKAGDRVIVPFSGGCGVCPMCRSGAQNICDDRASPGFRYWGGFGELVAVPRADYNLVGLPDEISFVGGACLGCRFMTAFRGLHQRAVVHQGEWGVVFGCGGLGLAAIHIASSAGARMIAVDIAQDKLDLARTVGAEHAVNAASQDAVEAIKEVTHGGATLAVDALGTSRIFADAVRCLRKQGRLLQLGLTGQSEASPAPAPLDMIVNNELTVFGSNGMAPVSFGPMLDLVARKILNPELLLTATCRLADASDVLAAMDSFETVGVTVISRG